MTLLKNLTLSCLLFTGFAIATPSARAGGDDAPRQYYGEWQKSSTASYYYRPYYYKPSQSYFGYKHHYVIYYPSRPTHYYFYNPYKNQFWGRCPCDHCGEPQYSQLAEQDRKEDIQQIPEKAFPKPTTPPVIPESKDNKKIDLPPDNTPETVGGLPKK